MSPEHSPIQPPVETTPDRAALAAEAAGVKIGTDKTERPYAIDLGSGKRIAVAEAERRIDGINLEQGSLKLGALTIEAANADPANKEHVTFDEKNHKKSSYLDNRTASTETDGGADDKQHVTFDPTAHKKESYLDRRQREQAQQHEAAKADDAWMTKMSETAAKRTDKANFRQRQIAAIKHRNALQDERTTRRAAEQAEREAQQAEEAADREGVAKELYKLRLKHGAAIIERNAKQYEQEAADNYAKVKQERSAAENAQNAHSSLESINAAQAERIINRQKEVAADIALHERLIANYGDGELNGEQRAAVAYLRGKIEALQLEAKSLQPDQSTRRPKPGDEQPAAAEPAPTTERPTTTTTTNWPTTTTSESTTTEVPAGDKPGTTEPVAETQPLTREQLEEQEDEVRKNLMDLAAKAEELGNQGLELDDTDKLRIRDLINESVRLDRTLTEIDAQEKGYEYTDEDAEEAAVGVRADMMEHFEGTDLRTKPEQLMDAHDDVSRLALEFSFGKDEDINAEEFDRINDTLNRYDALIAENPQMVILEADDIARLREMRDSYFADHKDDDDDSEGGSGNGSGPGAVILNTPSGRNGDREGDDDEDDVWEPVLSGAGSAGSPREADPEAAGFVPVQERRGRIRRRLAALVAGLTLAGAGGAILYDNANNKEPTEESAPDSAPNGSTTQTTVSGKPELAGNPGSTSAEAREKQAGFEKQYSTLWGRANAAIKAANLEGKVTPMEFLQNQLTHLPEGYTSKLVDQPGDGTGEASRNTYIAVVTPDGKVITDPNEIGELMKLSTLEQYAEALNSFRN